MGDLFSVSSVILFFERLFATIDMKIPVSMSRFAEEWAFEIGDDVQ